MDLHRVPDRSACPPHRAWVETAVLAAAGLAILALVGGRDAALLRHAFPWLALAPLLAGLRYGSGHGIACGAAQAVALVVASTSGTWAQGPVAGTVLGWLLAGLVPGKFHDAWLRRVRQAEARSDELNLRLEGLARGYHALKASHDRLQVEVPGSPPSLRDAFDAFRRGLIESPDGDSVEALGDRILALFHECASVRAATLHVVDGEGRPGPAASSLGTSACSGDDPLVRRAALDGEVVSVRELPANLGVLAAIPLVDVVGRVHAVVAVRDLPFLALHADTLALLALLGGHVGDVLLRALPPPSAAHDVPPARWFCSSVSRSMLDARRHGVPASLAIVELKTPPGELPVQRLLARHVAMQRRLTDDAEVLLDAEGNAVVVILLRLADAAGLRSFLARLERVARERARELGACGAIRVGGWPLEDSPLPIHPGDIEHFLTALLDGEAPAPDVETPGRDHGVVA